MKTIQTTQNIILTILLITFLSFFVLSVYFYTTNKHSRTYTNNDILKDFVIAKTKQTQN